MTTENVLVTGAAGEIGAAIVERFAAGGANIFATDLRDAALEDVMAGIKGSITTATCDLSDAMAAEALVGRAEDQIGPVDVLVNVAGVVPVDRLVDMTPEKWDIVMAVNVRAPMLLISELGRRVHASDRTAVVVNISSSAAIRARPGASHYSASKSALEMLTKSAAIEFGPKLRVNAISPGFVEVNSPVNTVSELYASSVAQNILGRRAVPDDIAKATWWMAGDGAAWVNGTTLRVDGGSTAGNPSLPLQNAVSL